MRRKRSLLEPELKRGWDHAVTENLLASDILLNVDCVYCYYSTEEEIDTTEFMQELLSSGKKVACPRVEKGEICFYYINTLTDCCPGFGGICEPVKGCRQAGDRDALVILPGLAFSLTGERLGYGGGYYDRFLTAEPYHGTAALAYKFQVVQYLPFDENDCRSEYIVTPEGITDTGVSYAITESLR